MCEKHSKKSKIRRKKRHFKLKKINYFTCGSIDVDKIFFLHLALIQFAGSPQNLGSKQLTEDIIRNRNSD